MKKKSHHHFKNIPIKWIRKSDGKIYIALYLGYLLEVYQQAQQNLNYINYSQEQNIYSIYKLNNFWSMLIIWPKTLSISNKILKLYSCQIKDFAWLFSAPKKITDFQTNFLYRAVWSNLRRHKNQNGVKMNHQKSAEKG